jgi:hypothetical protein
MDHINNVMGKAQQQLTTPTQAGSENSTAGLGEDAAVIVNRLFKNLKAIHPAWRQALSSKEIQDASKIQWITAFLENGITEASIIDEALALSRVDGKDFVPAVGQFIGYYRRAAMTRLGALETMTAYKHLLGYYALPVEHREPCNLDPLVYHMVSQVDFDVFTFKQLPVKPDYGSKITSFDYFSEHYQEVLKYALAGGVIKKPIVPDKRIGNPSGVVHTNNNKDRGNATLDSLKDLFK